MRGFSFSWDLGARCPGAPIKLIFLLLLTSRSWTALSVFLMIFAYNRIVATATWTRTVAMVTVTRNTMFVFGVMCRMGKIENRLNEWTEFA